MATRQKDKTAADAQGEGLTQIRAKEINSSTATSPISRLGLHLIAAFFMGYLVHQVVVSLGAADIFPRSLLHQSVAALFQPDAKQTPHPGLPIAIVYCTLINPSRRWKELLTLQMAELRTFGLASRALSIHVELSTDGDLFAPSNYLNKENTNVLDTAAEIVQALVPTAKVAVHSNNTFEYPGIHRVWEVATQHSDLPASTVLLYFHGKGMVNGEDGVIRSRGNEMLTRVVIEPWREILQHFQEKTELMKVGYAMAREGHVWHNFFWARASYVRRVVEPIISADRYYYEGWLGKLKPYDEETKEPLELQPTAAGPDEEQEFYQADAKDGLTLCGNNELKPGVAYEALAVPWC